MADLTTTLATLTELLKVQQEQIALLQSQQQAASSTRKIPLIEKLTKAEDLNSWREKLTRMLSRHDLDKYLLGTVQEHEETAARRTWTNDRLDVDDYIQATVPGHAVWNALRGLGWSAKDGDPKKTFDKLVQYFERSTVDAFANMHHELVTARRESFDSLSAFQTRINYLKERLETSDFKMTDKAYTWLALKGVASTYPDLYARCVTRIDTLTWNDLMAELQAQAVGENEGPTTTLIAVKDNEVLVKCKECPLMIKTTQRHCKDCGKHPGGGPAGNCWVCNPELAPDGWYRKDELLKKKLASTTGPLHQQAGLLDPSTTTKKALFTTGKKPDPKKVLFTTEMDPSPTLFTTQMEDQFDDG